MPYPTTTPYRYTCTCRDVYNTREHHLIECSHCGGAVFANKCGCGNIYNGRPKHTPYCGNCYLWENMRQYGRGTCISCKAAFVMKRRQHICRATKCRARFIVESALAPIIGRDMAQLAFEYLYDPRWSQWASAGRWTVYATGRM